MRSLDRIFRRNKPNLKTLAQWVKGLFSTGVNGAWYDPSDITRYMSSLGQELVTNGDFSTDTVWTKGTGWSISGGVAVAASIPSGSNLTGANFSTVSGEKYIAKITVPSFSSGQVLFLAWNGSANIGQSSAITASGTYQFVFTANTASTLVYVSGAGGVSSTLTVDNISVRELTDISTATLYQDAAGTTPVTAVGQPVGLMLDKSKGLVLGPELVTNGDFSNGTTGWTVVSGGTQSNVSGELQVTRSGAPGASSSQPITTVIGRSYKVTGVQRVVSGSCQPNLVARVGSSPIDTVVAAGISTTDTTPALNTLIFTASGTTTYIHLQVGSAAGTAGFDNISVRELPGNHAFNPSGNSANFPVLSARYNLLTKTEQFDDGVWFRSAGASATANSITLASAGDFVYSATTVTFPAGAAYTWSVQVNSSQRLITFGGATPAGTDTYSQVYMGGGVYRQMLTRAFTASGTASIQTMLGANQPAGSGTFNVSQADLRVSNDALNQPAYQRVNTATNYDTVGFKPYLSFNGVNQWLQTNSIDFTYGDKMFVAAGVRKLSDAAQGAIAELSSTIVTNLGSWVLFDPPGVGTSTVQYRSNGTLTVSVTGTAAPPVTQVLSGTSDISAPNAVLRVNGSQVAQSTASQGTGNYGNYQLYIGARAGTSLWFNGRLYGLVVAGKQASASEIASTEAWLNQKTGAY